MGRQYAFYLDSRFCSGCKACQVACKDQNGLEIGILWRRVYEVTGGGWEANGASWISTVFSYNLSIACNHCQKPICAQVCPTRAITKQADGIVLLDEKRCTGCKYCSWACPYGALQFNPASGRMSKCDFCRARLEQGLPPACVAACPLRVLEFGELDELEARYGPSPAIFPLPDSDLTRPALIVSPHHQAQSAAEQPARVSNWEEIRLGTLRLDEIEKLARQAALAEQEKADLP